MRGPGSALVLLVAALILGAATPGVGSASPLAPGVGLDVSVSATPSYGPAPLLVQFSASLPNVTPTAFNWSFGDGTYLNSTSSAAGHPTHLYERPSVYLAVVTVHVGSQLGSASVAVHATAAPLSVMVTANPLTGVAPLTVTLQGSVTGGTGTYVALNWTFGDGGLGTGSFVQYTYTRSGRFYAALTVQDSNGSRASGGVWINVTTDGSSSAVGVTGAGAVQWAALGFALGLGVALVVFPLRAFVVRRRASSHVPPPSTTGTLSGPAEAVPSVGPPGPALAPPGSTPPPEAGEALRTSQRLLVHLAGQGTLGPYDVAPPALTQGGMSTALGVRQNALTNVLRRLTDAGLIEAEVRHVHGQPRRLKVYRLTPRGQILARELRQRRPPRPAE